MLLRVYRVAPKVNHYQTITKIVLNIIKACRRD